MAAKLGDCCRVRSPFFSLEMAASLAFIAAAEVVEVEAGLERAFKALLMRGRARRPSMVKVAVQKVVQRRTENDLPILEGGISASVRSSKTHITGFPSHVHSLQPLNEMEKYYIIQV